MNADMLKGNLEMLLLATVAAQPLHGYAIIEALRARSLGAFDLPEGTVYPALHRLEQSGQLKSRWSDETGRRRRVYSVTAKGQKALARQQSEWQSFSNAVGAVLPEGAWAT